MTVDKQKPLRDPSTRFGPTASELHMIELQDQGLSDHEIAEMCGVSRRYVHDRLKRLSMDDSQPDREFWDMIREGSMKLAARIAQVHMAAR